MTSYQDLRKGIHQAFCTRKRPVIIIDAAAPASDIYMDAQQIASQDWGTLGWEDWQSAYSAMYGFTPEAFIYYLPSLLTLSAAHPDQSLLPVDGVLMMLDRSPIPEYWDEFFCERFLLLNPIECEAMSEWLIYLTKNSIYDDGTLGRAFDTLDLIRQAIANTS